MNQQHKLFQKRKGQSAIEYLMTYGWMLLVVAIVGGAIFATVQGQCATQASGFTGEAVTVENFGVTDADGLQVELANTGSQQINLTSVTVSSDDNSQANSTYTDSVGVGDTVLYKFSNVQTSDACNDYDLNVDYDQGEISGEANGGLSGNMEFN